MSQLRLFLPIGKVDEAQRLVYGTLTAETPDKSGEVFDYASGKPAVQAWSDEIKAASKGKSLGNVRAMHDNIAAGKFTDIVYDDDNKRIEGAAKIVDDAEWEKVLTGVYTGFSIGGSYTKRWQDKDNPALWRFTPKLTEISLVDNPCVGEATFEYIKADGTREMRKFTPSHNEDSMTKATENAAAATADATIPSAEVLLKAAQDAETAGTATDEQKALLVKIAEQSATPLAKDSKPAKSAVEPEQVWKASDGSTFATKNECRVYNLEIEKAAQLAPGVAQMEALLKGAKKPADGEDEEKAGDTDEEKKSKAERREKKAKEKEATEAAEKEAKEKADKDAAEKSAHAAAVQKAATDKAAQATAAPVAKGSTDTLAKGMHQVGWFAHLLDELGCFQNNVEMEQYFSGNEDSAIPDKLKSLISEMCTILITLVQEKTDELTEDDDDVDVLVLEMSAGLPAGHMNSIAKVARAKAEPLTKSDSKAESAAGERLTKFADALEKAGARHSKADSERVQALHDHSANLHKSMGDMVEKCAGMLKAAGAATNTAIDLGAKGDRVDDEDDMQPSEKAAAVRMSKLYEQLSAKTDEVLAVSKVAAASNETLLKAIPLLEGLQTKVGTLEQDKSDLTKRLEHLESQPLPAKGSAKAISKTQDGGDTGDGNANAEYKASLDKMTPDQRANELMKLALRNPLKRI